MAPVNEDGASTFPLGNFVNMGRQVHCIKMIFESRFKVACVTIR